MSTGTLPATAPDPPSAAPWLSDGPPGYGPDLAAYPRADNTWRRAMNTAGEGMVWCLDSDHVLL